MCFGEGSRRRSALQVSDLIDTEGVTTTRLFTLAASGVLDHFRALSALDQYLDGAVGELEQLQHARKRADLVDGLGRRLVVGRVLLGGEQDEGVGPHHLPRGSTSCVRRRGARSCAAIRRW